MHVLLFSLIICFFSQASPSHSHKLMMNTICLLPSQCWPTVGIWCSQLSHQAETMLTGSCDHSRKWEVGSWSARAKGWDLLSVNMGLSSSLSEGCLRRWLFWRAILSSVCYTGLLVKISLLCVGYKHNTLKPLMFHLFGNSVKFLLF